MTFSRNRIPPDTWPAAIPVIVQQFGSKKSIKCAKHGGKDFKIIAIYVIFVIMRFQVNVEPSDNNSIIICPIFSC